MAKTRILYRAALAALMFGASARAADVGWDAGGGADNTWNNSDNWTGVGVVPGFLDNIVLTGASAAGPQTIDLNGPRSISRIDANGVTGTYTFANSGAGALGFFADPNTSIILNQGANSTLIFNADLALNAAGEFFFNTDQDGGRITVNGDVTTAAASGISVLNLTSRNLGLSDVVQVNGVISDGLDARMSVGAGFLGDAVNHRGQVLLSGLNTFTGSTFVNGATLAFNSIADYGPGAAASALGAPTVLSDAVISLGANAAAPNNVVGTLRYVGVAPGGHSSNRPFQFVGTSPGGTIESSGVGPLVLSGGLSSTLSSTVNRTLTLGGTNTGENIFSGVIGDVPGAALQHMVKSAAGKWILTATNDYGGNTTVSGGELVLQGSSATIGPVVAGAVSVNAGGTLTIDGGGSVRANDFNNTGTLNFKSGELDLISGNTTTGGGSFAIGTSGIGRVLLSGGSNNFGAITLHGSDDQLIISGGGTFGFLSLDNSAGGTFSAITANVQIDVGQITTTHGEIRSRIQGNGGLTKIGPGTLDLTNSTIGSIYTGPTNIMGGTLRLISAAAVNSLPDASPVTIAAGAALDITQMSGGETIGRLAGAGSVLTADNRDLTLNTTAAASFAGAISGAGNLTKLGAGAQTFSGASDYTGSTTVAAGSLILAAGGSLDGTENVFVSGSGTVMTIGGGSVVTPGVFRAENSGTTLNLSSGTLDAMQLDTASGTQYLSTFNWSGGTVHLGSLTRISGSIARDDQPFRNALTLTPAKTLIVDSTLAVDSGGTLNIDGGLVAANGITTSSGLFGALHGTINFNAGTMRIMGDQTLDAEAAQRLDVDTPIQSNRVLEVLGAANISTPITLAGGTLTVNDVVNPQNLVLDSGTFNVAVGALAVPAGNSVDASSGMTINAAGGLAVAATAEFNAIGADLNAAAPSVNDGQINAINSTLNFGAGGLTNNGAMNLIGSTVNGAVTASAGTAIVTSGAVTFNGNVLRGGGGGGGGTLHVAGGAVSIAAGGNKTIAIASLELGGNLDLNDNKLIVTAGDVGSFSGGSYSGLTGKIASAYNFSAWDGPGIRTSMPAAGPAVGLTTIAIATADETFYAGGTFGGVAVDSGDVLLMYTYAGDANLDGLVDAADYGAIDNFVQFPGSFGYANGDFNYDGIIDAADYGIIDNTIQLQGPPIPAGTYPAYAGAVAAVPEPGAATLLLAGAGALLRRRRKS